MRTPTPTTPPPATAPARTDLPAGVAVFERGWLSSNNILLLDGQRSVLVDTGYCTHAAQTLALVEQALGGRALDAVFNTHLHSDHCGGNAALQARYPQVVTHIPPGLAQAVADWDEGKLGYNAVGQSMVSYGFNELLLPGSTQRMGGCHWQVHAAPGHDNHALLLFEPASRTLISADALWQQGFGVVFPELGGDSGFAEAAATLDLIERLAPAVVIPGHGAVFSDVAASLAVARARLQAFVAQPERHTRHAAKVLLKYKLLELGSVTRANLLAWAQATPMLAELRRPQAAPVTPPLQTPPQPASAPDFEAWLADVLADLVHTGALGLAGDVVFNP